MIVQELIGLLRAKSLRIATAESCTGGLIAKMITDVPGSSDVFEAGAVTYSNRMKTKILGVDENILHTSGAVSPETARAMAVGLSDLTGAEICVSVTGIAGPGGGTAKKPVGLVYAGFYCTVSGRLEVIKFIFPGSRDDVRRQTAEAVLSRAYNIAEGL